jgi:hypothetical protein
MRPHKAILSACAMFAQERPDPANASIRVTPAQYRSAFSDYQSHKEEQPVPWKDANATAERLAGHKGHIAAKPAEEKSPAADGQPNQPKPDSAPHRHGAHK